MFINRLLYERLKLIVPFQPSLNQKDVWYYFDKTTKAQI